MGACPTGALQVREGFLEAEIWVEEGGVWRTFFHPRGQIHRPSVGKSMANVRNLKKLYLVEHQVFGDRTERGGMEEDGEVSRAHIAKGLISHCQKPGLQLGSNINLLK